MLVFDTSYNRRVKTSPLMLQTQEVKADRDNDPKLKKPAGDNKGSRQLWSKIVSNYDKRILNMSSSEL